MDLLEKYKKEELREEYLKLRLQINELDEFFDLNDLEVKGFRVGDLVYVKNKAIYSCIIVGFTKKRCRVKYVAAKPKSSEKVENDYFDEYAFDRIHKHPSDIGLNKYYSPARA